MIKLKERDISKLKTAIKCLEKAAEFSDGFYEALLGSGQLTLSFSVNFIAKEIEEILVYLKEILKEILDECGALYVLNFDVVLDLGSLFDFAVDIKDSIEKEGNHLLSANLSRINLFISTALDAIVSIGKIEVGTVSEPKQVSPSLPGNLSCRDAELIDSQRVEK